MLKKTFSAALIALALATSAHAAGGMKAAGSLHDLPHADDADDADARHVPHLSRILRQARRTHGEAHAEPARLAPRRAELHVLPQHAREAALRMQRLPHVQHQDEGGINVSR